MKKHIRKTLALLLTLCVIIGMLPVMAFAATSQVSDGDAAETEQTTVNLVDWVWLSGTSTYALAKRQGIDGASIKLIVDAAGNTSDFGNNVISAHATAEIVYDIAGKGVTRFQSYVGVNSAYGTCGFQVYTDASQVPLYSVDCVYGTEPVHYVDVEIPAEATTLTLITTNGGDNNNYDHGTWAAPVVIVNPAADSVSLKANSMVLEEGVTRSLAPTIVRDGEVTNAPLTWTSSNESVVTVNYGTVTAVGKGSATVTVSVATPDGGTASASCDITVVEPYYRLADGWQITNEDPHNWSITGEDNISILTQYGEFRKVNGVYTAKCQNLFLRETEESDFEISARLEFQPDANYESAGIIIYAADNAHLVLARRYHTNFNNQTLGTHGVDNGTFMETAQADPSTTQAPIWLKMAKSGSTVTASYSLDGESWTQHDEPIIVDAFAGAENFKVGLYTGDSQQNNNTVATFSEFTIKYPNEETASPVALAAVNENSPVRADAVKEVMDLIDAIGTVTADSTAAIDVARSAYQLLTTGEQKQVTNLAVLEKAEQEMIWFTLGLNDLQPFTGDGLDLPVELADGTKLYWETSDVAHITENGIVSRDPGKDVTVTLTATMVNGDGMQTRDFEVLLKADPDARERENMNILQIGDSNTEYGNLTQNLKEIINEDVGDYGTGFTTLANVRTLKAVNNISISKSGSWTNHDVAGDGSDGDTPDSLNGLTTEGSYGATITISFTGSAVDLYYLAQPGAGSFQVTIDGVDKGSVDTGVTGDKVTKVAAYDDLKYGKHEMVITVTRSSVTLHGVDIIVGDRDSRSVIHTWGNATARALDYAGFTQSVFTSGLQELNPNKVVILLGTNDHGYGKDSSNTPVPADEFEEYLVTIIERVKKALPEAEIWLLSTFETNDTFRAQSLPTLYEYWETSFPNAAQRTGVNYWDMGSWFGEYDSIKMQDTWHVNSKYGRIIMEKLYELLCGSPMTAQELAEAVDALIVTNGEQVAEVEDLIARYMALDAGDKAAVGAERISKLQSNLSRARILAAGGGTVIVADQSANGFDVDLTEKTSAGLTLYEGKTALEGWFRIDQEGADGYYAEHLSGENSYTAVATIYIDSAMKDDPNHYHMVYSTGDRGTALRVNRENAGLKVASFVYTGSGWVGVNSGYLGDEYLDRWLTVATTYDAAKNTISMWVEGLTKTAAGASNLKSTTYGLGVGYDPQETLRKSNLKIADLRLFGKVLTGEELAANSMSAGDESVLLWYDFSEYAVAIDEVPVADVKLDKTEAELIVGEELTLTATVTPENAVDKSVIWETSDASVATVENGKVTAVAAGSTTITAKAGDKSAACVVTVAEPVVEVAGVELNQTSAELTVGGELALTATVKPDNATDKSVTWSTSNEKVATVVDGKVTAVAAGTATITVTAGGKREQCVVSVVAKTVEVSGVKLDKDTAELEVGEELTLSAVVAPEDATDQTVTWSSSDESVATVADGKVTAVGAGEAAITAQVGEQSATCVVTVTKPAVEPPVNPFIDVKEEDYFFDSALWAVEEGITVGDGAENTFNPEGDCLREQVVTFLWRAAGEPEPETTKNPFKDIVEADYFYKAVLWAYENDIVKGVEVNEFGPKQSCTRAQVAAFLFRYDGSKAVQTRNPFTDLVETEYYVSAVLWAVENGITKGDGSETTFNPNGTCTRAQIVTFLYRYLVK